jgi:hypothetical protein
MQKVELKVTIKDWLYIIIIGAFFGFFISLFFYFLNKDLQNFSTIVFSISAAVFISLFASILISISNNFILPRVNQRFWYLISFIFSFCYDVEKIYKVDLRQGDAVIFPSFIQHRADTVTYGTRHSLVGWVLGAAPFK